MKLNYSIAPNAEMPQRGVQGNFIYVAAADGTVSLTVETVDGNKSVYELNKKDQLHFPVLVQSIGIENKTALINNVEILVGFGQFLPSADGLLVTITNAPLSDTELRASPVPVSTGGLTDTQLRTAPVPVSTGGLTDTQLRASPVPIKPVDSGAFAAPAQVTGSGSIAANASRRGVIIKSKTGNSGTIDTGASGYGIPLDAGESVTIETTAAITITCSNPADVWGYVEY